MILSSVLLPTPLLPMSPMRSPRITLKARGRRSKAPRHSDATRPSSRSHACLRPRRRRHGIRARPWGLMRSAYSRRMRSSSRMRPALLVRRASTPRRTQTSSSASFLSNSAVARASASIAASRATWKLTQSPGNDSSRARSISTTRVASDWRNARSWVTNNSVPSNSLSLRSSQPMVARSRWLVGSSSSNSSGFDTSARARPTRRRQPPDNSSSIRSPGRSSSVSTVATRCSTFQPPSSSIACWSSVRSRRPGGVELGLRQALMLGDQPAQMVEPPGDMLEHRDRPLLGQRLLELAHTRR